MLIIDDLLLAPIQGVIWVVEKIGEAAQEDHDNESVTITNALSELYLLLETGQVSEDEFDSREKELLDRLEALSTE
jgi:hypothetical protein